MVAYASTVTRGGRATAFGLAASLALAVAPGFSSSSFADDADAALARATASCSKFKDSGLHTQCVYDALGKATQALKKDIVIQQRRAAEADRRRAEFVRQGVEADRRGALADDRIAAAKARSAAAKDRSAAAKGRSAAADAQGRDAELQGAAADRRAAQSERVIETADAAKACYDGIKQEVVAAKRVAPLTPEQKTAFRARAAGCERS